MGEHRVSRRRAGRMADDVDERPVARRVGLHELGMVEIAARPIRRLVDAVRQLAQSLLDDLLGAACGFAGQALDPDHRRQQLEQFVAAGRCHRQRLVRRYGRSAGSGRRGQRHGGGAGGLHGSATRQRAARFGTQCRSTRRAIMTAACTGSITGTPSASCARRRWTDSPAQPRIRISAPSSSTSSRPVSMI